jgi:ZIP family zinc transporter
MESAGALSVFLFALLTAVATGLGAVPFAFAKHPTRRWLGASNAVAAGLMLAASFGLIYEGMDYGPLRAGGRPARSGVHRDRTPLPPAR